MTLVRAYGDVYDPLASIAVDADTSSPPIERKTTTAPKRGSSRETTPWYVSRHGSVLRLRGMTHGERREGETTAVVDDSFT